MRPRAARVDKHEMRPHDKRRIVARPQRLPAMLADTTIPVSEEILREEQQRLFGRIVGARVLLVPFLAAIILGLAWMTPRGPNTVVLIGLALAIPAFFVFELVHYRRQGFTPSALPRNVVVAALAQLVVCAASGGLASPFIYAALPLAAVLGAFVSLRLYLACTLVQLSAVWAFVFVSPHAVPWMVGAALRVPWPNAPARAWYEYAHAGTLSAFLLMAGQVGRGINHLLRGTLGRALNARQELLKAHSDRVHELTSLSAEIAHELKNPLFSVKGLARLLEQNVNDTKGMERLNVLKREVDRMQTVLEEFLNFSRPLVPLTSVSTDVSSLAAEVVALHEGMARERGVNLYFQGEVSNVRCDPRKVKQILINLVQNALEASPRGAEIVVATQLGPQGVVVRVRDEGRGLDSTLQNPFEPGATTKAGGAGIGLTIARALARQHGGELAIGSNDDGPGATAELSLPNAPSTAPAAARKAS